ncbi:protein translocase subunit SecDF [Xylanibacter oryzae]|uniref:protein translocase subunit SecDF n=1 Tax=Xylanibacter oryzae TaxID=185293 RepID=UPI00056A05AF|nr:protein translocase subunit SecDF [Xylanibacter oryzae]
MQNKGLVKFITLLLILVCVFYLSFSFVTRHYESKAAAMEKVKKGSGQEYLDSLKNEKVYMGVYSLKQCGDMEIGLGLDLKGGMNVILEVSVPDVIEVLADHKTDAAFVKSMNEAKAEEEQSHSDFISLFVSAYKQNAPGHHLAEIFATQQMKGKVSTSSSNSEVERALRAEVSSAVDNSYNVVRNRIDKFGVVQPNIQKLEGQMGRIMVEMPGVKEPERVRKLLQGSANLEFWETYNNQEIAPYLQQLDSRLANGADTASAKKDTASVGASSVKTGNLAAALSAKAGAKNKAKENAQVAQAKKAHPLFSIFQPSQGESMSVVGYASFRDTAAIDRMIYSQVAKQVLPSDVKLLWSAKSAEFDKKGEIFELHAIKVTESSGRAPLEGNVIINAKDEFDNFGRPCVSMQMNPDGARRWAQLTKANIGKAIAIVLDGSVYSAPRVSGEIDGGSSNISGNFTIEDTKDLANTLKSGKMPAPTRIVQEEIVGPSLGAESIQQGISSFAIAFVLLMVYMVLLYDVIPGMLANMAMMFNLFFTLGILTSFQAALTMPGIAGIVLSLSIAVDANVLIYERTKEELRAGKNARDAMKAGYSKAFSAIFDSNFTSIITGVILYVFGTGPIRGFATTLIIGICCSFFTAVFMTRLVFEHQMRHDRWLNQNFVTKFSRHMLQNTKINFIGYYKKAFYITVVLIAVFIACFFVRGLSKSIDFTGGRNYVVKFDKAIEPEQVRDAITPYFPNSTVGAISLGTDHKTIRISTNYKIESNKSSVDGEVETILFKALTKSKMITQKSVDEFKKPDVGQGGSIISSTKVGPSVAKDITYGAIVSVILSLIAIFLYILLRFRNMAYSVGSTIALAIDTVIVIGFYSMLWGIVPFSLEIDQTFIGAILTITGYSVIDKVVVFDRVREIFHLRGNKGDIHQTFNDALNATLSRTVNTSMTVLIVLLCIFFFGGESIRSFSFAMVIGVIFGTLSSVFVAAPIAYLIMEREAKNDKGHEAEMVEAKV